MKNRNCPRCGNFSRIVRRSDYIWFKCDDCFTFSSPASNDVDALKIWNETEEFSLYGIPLSDIKKK
jgi:ribosomal protein L37AE/L43A